MNWLLLIVACGSLDWSLVGAGIPVTSLTFWLINFQIWIFAAAVSSLAVERFKGKIEATLVEYRDKIFSALVTSAYQELARVIGSPGQQPAEKVA